MTRPATIYLDHNATTPAIAGVAEFMADTVRGVHANPSSIHPAGQAARHLVERARASVAALISAAPQEIVFTSGGTESINLAIRSGLEADPSRRHMVTTSVEHAAVLQCAESMKMRGVRVELLSVDGEGRIDEQRLRAAVTPQTALVSLIHANNETGVVWDIERLAAGVAECGASVHVDAVQSAGKRLIDVTRWPGVGFVSLSAHKLGGPTGVGALFVRRGSRISPQIIGGGQERGLRGGTENVVGIAGLGWAAEALAAGHSNRAAHVRTLRDRLENGLVEGVSGARVVGTAAERLYNTACIVFPGARAEVMLILLGQAGVCASSGAACSSGSLEPSHVLLAMGLSEDEAGGALRFSLAESNTDAEIERVLAIMPGIVAQARSMPHQAAEIVQ